MEVVVGTYTGTGIPGKRVEVGVVPDIFLTKDDNPGAGAVAVFRTTSMDDGLSEIVWGGSSSPSDSILRFINEIGPPAFKGVELGSSSDVNGSGRTYHYLAIRDNNAGHFAWGEYTGDGNTTQAITGVGLQGTVGLVKDKGSGYGYWRTAGMAANASFILGSNSASTTGIRSFDADGFTVGITLNALGVTYHYFVLLDVAGFSKAYKYTGTAAATADISDPGFQPDWAMVKRNGNTGAGNFRSSTFTDAVGRFFSNLGNAASCITAFHATGFTRGNSAHVNNNGTEFYYWAIKAGISGEPPAPEPQATLPGGLAFDLRPYRMSWTGHTSLEAEQFVYHDAPGDGNILTYLQLSDGTNGAARVQFLEGSDVGDDKTVTGTPTPVAWQYQTGISQLDRDGEVARLLYVTVEFDLAQGSDEQVLLDIQPYLKDEAGDVLTYTLHGLGSTDAGYTQRRRCPLNLVGDAFNLRLYGQTNMRGNIEIRQVILEWVPLRALKGS